MEVRDDLILEARKYLMGPSSEDEILHDWPEELYVSGLLFPKNVGTESEDLETLDAGGSSEDGEQDTENSRQPGLMLQNSIGIRCNLNHDAKEVEAEITYARYRQEAGGWRRIPVMKKFTIHLNDDQQEREILDDNNELEAKISSKVDADKSPNQHYKVLSVFLSNETFMPEDYINDEKLTYIQKKILKNGKIIFQPSIKLEAVVGNAQFLGTNLMMKDVTITEEERMLEMLFREKIVFAQGYGCAADWDRTSKSPKFVRTEILPEYEARNIVVSRRGDDERPDLIDMTNLAFANNPSEVDELVSPLIVKYEKWIEKLADKIKELKNNPEQSSLAENAEENHRRCVDALLRMKDGVSLLKDSAHPEIFEAFVIANRAMLYQRAHYDYAIKKSKGKKDLPKRPDVTRKNENFWRPFQVAFLLMNIRGISEKESNDREIVDLLWFPTGGGKTEAYLGLSAFAMVLRRLRGASDEGDGLGVSVIMRYTLRLLTLQQFERAATLVCALEYFRRKEPKKLGREPFLIGLWVGWSLTPNSTADSKDALDRLGGGQNVKTGSPIQLIFCPWCGKDMSYKDYVVDEKRTGWTIAHCNDPGCDFYHREKNDLTRALPVLTVDFDIYRRCPTMLISTVDKFARLPWKPEISSIFGLVERKCPRCGFLSHPWEHTEGYHREGGTKISVEPHGNLDGPDLIIQDELHLITGPIGTMVGLYETAVEFLSSRNGSSKTIKPKIVVSTATINGVERQIRKLFNRRQLQTFPPPGILYGDTFFWWEDTKSGRKFVGVSYSHRSMKFALAKIYSSLLQRVSEMSASGASRELIDPYWTLVGYFNSRRELGGAIRLVQDDVRSNISKIVNGIPSHAGLRERHVKDPVELTGGVKGEDIRDIRRNLELDLQSPDSIDVLLATNMISVGIDVDRLGLMVVNGQTKNTAEYIQATGRIGRRENIQGLVFTLYNPYKPRDLSHYEDFIGTHMLLQKSVEPVGLTPFSDRAMERALHGVFIGMIRLAISNLSANASAGAFTLGNVEVMNIQKAILDRYLSVQDVDEKDQDYATAKIMLHQFQDNWFQFIQDSLRQQQDVYYWDDSQFDRFGTMKRKQKVLMVDFAAAGSDGRGRFPKATPGSLRDVETEANMFYV